MLRNCLLSFVLVFTANQRSKNMFISHLAIGFLSVVHLTNVALQVPEYLSCAGQRKKSTDLASVDFPCQTASPLSGKKRKKNKRQKIFRLGGQITMLGPSLGLAMSYRNATSQLDTLIFFFFLCLQRYLRMLKIFST